MVLIQDLYKLHNSPELRSLRNKFRLQYRLAIKRKKIAENDTLIKNALNPTKAMWCLISKQKNSGDISPNDFIDYFIPIPAEISEKFGEHRCHGDLAVDVPRGIGFGFNLLTGTCCQSNSGQEFYSILKK
ncbi:hypothetical protein WA026_019603 [Henosepilachna vigintioctopunctata]|uniref:Uncharacterized protein n=1 Tax=Henosepilachna vigintioctopunctata TaxID=420089 RepID=A0AAW1U0C8_9CUCU